MHKLALGFLAFVILLGSPGLATGDLDPKEQKSRQRKLKSRAGAYLKARKALVKRCPSCNGAGHKVLIRSGTGGRVTRSVKCDGCRGHGFELSAKYYLQLEYHLKSPTFRLVPNKHRDVQRSLEREQRKGPPTRVTRTSLKGVALHGEFHGITWIKENKEKEYRPLLWIWATEPGEGEGEWYLFDEKVDGDWPTAEDLATASTPNLEDPDTFDVRDTKEIEAGEREKIDAELKRLGVVSKLLDARRKEDVFALFLELGTGGQNQDARRTAMTDAITLFRAIHREFPNLDGTRLQFLATYKDRFGALSKRILLIVSADHHTLSKIVWENLEATEVFDLFHVDWKNHSGFTLIQ